MNNDRKISLPGLPPLPKSLSAATGAAPLSNTYSVISSPLNNTNCGAENELFLGPSTSATAAARNIQRHGSLSTQESLSDRESLHSRASSSHSHSSHHTPSNDNDSGSTSTLDAQIAILRREMYGLRQLDLSLLSQLWALNESIQGFRVFLQEQDMLSPPSPDTNSLDSEQEDESFLMQPKLPQLVPTGLPGGSITSHASSSASGTSGSSSAASSMGKHCGPVLPTPQKAHPQLPRILQQRMRRAPPPPPPTRPKQPSPANKAPVLQRPV